MAGSVCRILTVRDIGSVLVRQLLPRVCLRLRELFCGELTFHVRDLAHSLLPVKGHSSMANERLGSPVLDIRIGGMRLTIQRVPITAIRTISAVAASAVTVWIALR